MGLKILIMCILVILTINNNCPIGVNVFCKQCYNTTNLCKQCNELFWVNNSGQCQSCSSNCLSCNQDNCFKCDDGFYPISENCSACLNGCGNCSQTDGNYCLSCNNQLQLLYKHKCVDCSQVINNCSECSTSLYCTKCNNGFFMRQIISDSSQNATQCVSCDQYQNCQTCNGSEICGQCKPNYYLDGSQCKPCPQGTYQLNNQCKNCVNNCKICQQIKNNCSECDIKYKISQPNTCSRCLDTEYTFNLTECKPCQYPCLQCNTLDFCTSCQQGYELNPQTGQCNKICGNTEIYNSSCDQLLGNYNCTLNCQTKAGLKCISTQCVYDGQVTIKVEKIQRLTNENTLVMTILLQPALYLFQQLEIDYLFKLSPSQYFSQIHIEATQTGLIITAEFQSDVPTCNLTLTLNPNIIQHNQLQQIKQSSLTFQLLKYTDKKPYWYTSMQFTLITVISVLGSIVGIVSLILGIMGLYLKDLSGLQLLIALQFVFINLITFQNYLLLPFQALQSLYISTGYHYSSETIPYSQDTYPSQLTRFSMGYSLHSNYNYMALLYAFPIILALITYCLSLFQIDFCGVKAKQICKWLIQQMLFYFSLFNITYAFSCIIIFYQNGLNIYSFWSNLLVFIIVLCTLIPIILFIKKPFQKSLFIINFNPLILCGKCWLVWIIAIIGQILLLHLKHDYLIGPLLVQISMVFFIMFYQPYTNRSNNVLSSICWSIICFNSIVSIAYQETTDLSIFKSCWIPLIIIILLLFLTIFTAYHLIRKLVEKIQQKTKNRQQFLQNLNKNKNDNHEKQILQQLNMMYMSSKDKFINEPIKQESQESQNIIDIDLNESYYSIQPNKRNINQQMKNRKLNPFDVKQQQSKFLVNLAKNNQKDEKKNRKGIDEDKMSRLIGHILKDTNNRIRESKVEQNQEININADQDQKNRQNEKKDSAIVENNQRILAQPLNSGSQKQGKSGQSDQQQLLKKKQEQEEEKEDSNNWLIKKEQVKIEAQKQYKTQERQKLDQVSEKLKSEQDARDSI